MSWLYDETAARGGRAVQEPSVRLALGRTDVNGGGARRTKSLSEVINEALQVSQRRDETTPLVCMADSALVARIMSLPAAEPRPRHGDLPTKLYAILSSPECEHIVSWMPHGYAWKVKDAQLFVRHVLPLFFESKSYPNSVNTFVRLLKLWGFRQFTKGPDASAYFHELFLRGMPDLHSLMRPSLENGLQPLHVPESEPDFYRLRPLPQGALMKRCFVPTATDTLLHAAILNASTTQMLEALQALSSGMPPQLTLPPSAYDSQPKEHSLRAAQYVHDQTVKYLLDAKTVADTTASSGLVAQPSPEKATFIRKTKARRKWLPPLGPAVTKINPLLEQQHAASKATNSSNSYDWIFTNPEVFASLAESLK